ncbi:MAG: DUF3127 domain-containing protein [Flavobacteriales bacterium]|jgi:hypothetical protein|uniref:DUF3127 domain-containing protein n=1 Tax=Blattabacterium sp. (Mastotermes darwiniensis) TaxID=39768 RepID=UPI000231DF5D|nr:DUF3127 domain-containing protein [Blattabacterium sp. (Mastotermes darwiniensis)]AER40373.1 hypothetical protein MADAR_048 [Blattabacterium sp. (Mastotermes darwiniensis) str. MADAR]MDR1804906.1 DUF3127 domain-containing protein [Flavobacteriales bacterium]
MEIIGRVKKLFDIQKFDSGFRKREIVLTTEEPYPQNILIEFIQDKVDLLGSISPEDKIKVFINIRGREWTNPEGIIKYFNSIQGWKIEEIQQKNSKKQSTPSLSSDDFDDLPF